MGLLRVVRIGATTAGAMLCALVVLGCLPRKPPTPAYQPTFDYTPPSVAPPNSAKVTFALVSARYAKGEPWTRVSPFTTFSKNLSSDFQELLAARGFTVRGPFNSYDEMTFPDKKNSDLVLTPDIDVTVNSRDASLVPGALLGGFRIQATIVVTGHVTLSLRESLTGERMWLKSIELPQSPPVTAETDRIYPSNQQIPKSAAEPTALLADPAFSAALGPVMENYYKVIMENAWRYLDPQEMAMVKKQTAEIRARKVY